MLHTFFLRAIICSSMYTDMCTKEDDLLQQAGILGWGYHLPSRVLTNHELEQMVETSDEWIRTRTGIQERRIAAATEATSDLASAAAQMALAQAGLAPNDIDLIIVATVTPDMAFPATACLVQASIGATRAAAFDLSAACSGFIYGLALAKNMIETGAIRNCLLIGAETLSRITDYEDRNTCVLFGDGAGALIVGPSEEHVLLSVEVGADGTGGHVLQQPAGGSRQPASAETVATRQHFIKMDGQEVFKFAVSKVPEAALRLLTNTGLSAQDVAWFVPHQANKRIIDSVAKRLGLSSEQVIINLQHYGNVSNASIPIALAEAAESNSFQTGQHILLAGFGGGLTWGAGIVQW